jgi:hypothetical protein
VASVFDRARWVYTNVSYALKVFCHPRETAAAVQHHLGRIQGTCPRPTAHGVICFACDERFLERFGYNFIWSCYEHAPACSVHVHLYEPSALTLRRLHALQAHVSALQLSYTYEREIDFGRLPGGRGKYYAAFRFVAARKILQESKSLLLWLDADSLIMHGMQPLFAAARQHDVGLYFRLRKRTLNKKVAAFCAIFNYTPPSLAFLDSYAGITLKLHQHYPATRTHFWFDQSGLYCAYVLSKLKGKVSFYAVGKNVVDYDFAANAYIWTAKGERKQEEAFLQESQRLREQYAATLESPG